MMGSSAPNTMIQQSPTTMWCLDIFLNRLRYFACMTPPDGMLRCLMRYCMRRILFMMPLLAVAIASAQTMTEVGASAAGSAIGSAAGKKVSDGITAIFGKVDKTTSKAAAKTPAEDNSKAAPLLDVGPGAPRVSGGGSAGGGGGG